MAQHPSERTSAPPASWYLLAVVTTLLVLGMVDRLSLTLLVAPIKRELGIGDAQMSLLLGPSFALLYSTVGLPAGHFIDRYNRRNLLLCGALVWTLMTFASAFAPNYEMLFLARAGVGLGEAVLSPAMYSMIRDSFPQRQRSLAYGIGNMGSPLGTGFALVAIGHVSGWAEAGELAWLPGLGHLSDWRTVLGVIGLAGVPVALLLLTTREPRRISSGGDDAEEASVAAVLAWFRKWRGPYLCIYLSTAFYGTALNGMLSWAPEALSRGWDVPVKVIGPRMGTLQLIAAPSGLLLAGLILSLVRKRNAVASLAWPGAVALALAALLIGVWSRSDYEASWVWIGMVLFLTPWSGVTLATLIAQLTPSRMMGKVSAVNFLMLGLVGMIAGPTLNPFLARFFAGSRALQSGVGLGSGVAMALSSLALLMCGVLIARRERQPDSAAMASAA